MIILHDIDELTDWLSTNVGPCSYARCYSISLIRDNMTVACGDGWKIISDMNANGWVVKIDNPENQILCGLKFL